MTRAEEVAGADEVAPDLLAAVERALAPAGIRHDRHGAPAGVAA
jgi:hypothetical protein